MKADSPRNGSIRRGRRRRVAAVEGPDPIDAHVGRRVRLRRILMGMSQVKLGEAIGLTFQQVQKYERAANRVSASTLYRIAQVLDVPLSFFFDDMVEVLPLRRSAEADVALTTPESVELARHYFLLPNPARKLVFDLVKVMARQGSSQEEANE